MLADVQRLPESWIVVVGFDDAAVGASQMLFVKWVVFVAMLSCGSNQLCLAFTYPPTYLPTYFERLVE